MAEFMSKEEIDALIDIFEDEQDILETDNIKTIKYNGTLNEFYKSSSGYNTEDEAKFRFYKEQLEKLQLNIKTKRDDILREQQIIDNILKNHSELFLKFSEELL
jgi:hypothetical protein